MAIICWAAPLVTIYFIQTCWFKYTFFFFQSDEHNDVARVILVHNLPESGLVTIILQSTVGIWIPNYSGGSNTEHSNSEPIRKPNVSKFGFRMVESSVFEWSGPFENRTMDSLGRFIKINKFSFYIKRPSLERPFWKVLIWNGPDHSKTEHFKMAALA